MSIKEYISSGILEAYVLGDLTAQERAEVERNLAQYPELRQELSTIEQTQEHLLMSMAVKPATRVKANIFNQIEKSTPASEAKVISINRDSSKVWRFAAAASISIALISSYLAYNYWNKWQTTSKDLTALIAQNQQVAQDYNQVNQRLNQLENEVSVIDNPQFKKVVMKGTPNAPEALAAVYWNESTKEVYLRIQNMKALARDNQYQLWAIIDGKPVDAGVFDANIAGLVKMKDVAKGAALFAVTIEPRGGKASPTLETMQVAGEVEKKS